MHVAVAIVGFRNACDIARCLGALEQSSYRDFEVSICENGGQQAFAELSEILPARLTGGQQVRAELASGNLGYAGGVNKAMSMAPEADAWWVLNPDTQPEPEALQRLVQRLSQGDCEAVGGRLYRGDGKVQTLGGRWRPWLARAESIGFGIDRDAAVDPNAIEADMNYVTGASMLVGRRFFETVGPMQEDYFLYCEEIEWCLRARQAGLRFGLAPDARVLHGHGSTTGSGEQVSARPKLPIYLDERNKMLLTRDHYPWRLPIAASAAFALLTWRYLVRGAPAQFGYAVQGWRDGLWGRRGVPSFVLPKVSG